MNRIIHGCALGSALAITSALVGCSASPTPTTPVTKRCRESAGDDVAQGARKAGQGIEEGAEVGVAGVKQAGAAVGGLIADGSSGAEQRWNEKKVKTDQEIAEGRAERRAEDLPPCP